MSPMWVCHSINRVGCSQQGVLAQNSDKLFGKRNFMQPMGRPKQALQGWGALLFFLFSFGEGRIFFHFSLVPMCSHYVPFKFPMGSHQVSNVFPNMFSIAPDFYPMCLGRCCPPFTYIGGQKGRTSILLKENLLFW